MLDSAGIRLAVVSQKARRGLAQLMAQLDIDQYFDLVLGSDDVTAPKPQAALYERHIAPWSGEVERDRVLVVGDTDIDLRFAANIGARELLGRIRLWSQRKAAAPGAGVHHPDDHGRDVRLRAVAR